MTRFLTIGSDDTDLIKACEDTLARRMTLAAIVAICTAAAGVLGVLSGLSHSAQHNHSRGACIALEFAENFGAIATTQKRQALRALTTSAGRHHGLFPNSVEEFEDLCTRTWTSEVRIGR
jgi:hypothetical protein